MAQNRQFKNVHFMGPKNRKSNLLKSLCFFSRSFLSIIYYIIICVGVSIYFNFFSTSKTKSVQYRHRNCEIEYT